MITAGRKVRSKGALFVRNADGSGYRKVYNGTVLATWPEYMGYDKHGKGMGVTFVAKVETRYGIAIVNVEALSLISKV